ncbi:MAG: hypothetical protein QXV17_11705 [Candidatus Micrarchaeaceae archaeon]
MNSEIDQLKKENSDLKSALIKAQHEIEIYRQKINLLMDTNNDLRDMIEGYAISTQSLSNHLEVIMNHIKEISENIARLKVGEWE